MINLDRMVDLQGTMIIAKEKNNEAKSYLETILKTRIKGVIKKPHARLRY